MENMNKKLLEYLNGYPPLYTPSTAPFWDDEHISKQMLAAHLNPDWDAATRKPAFVRQSAEWISSYCGGGHGKKLLDLGCGPGLYAELFAKQGFSVTGVDFSKRSIAYAKEQTAKNSSGIDYYYKNYLSIDYENEFDAVTLIYCDFGVLPTADRAVLLKKVLKALKPGGVFILDGHSEGYDAAYIESSDFSYNDSGFWADEPYVAIERSRRYSDTRNFLDQTIVVTEGRIQCYNIWNQIYTGESITAELKAGGFGSVELFDDVAGAEFTGKAENLCAAARKD